jgi:hypothetical protein
VCERGRHECGRAQHSTALCAQYEAARKTSEQLLVRTYLLTVVAFDRKAAAASSGRTTSGAGARLRAVAAHVPDLRTPHNTRARYGQANGHERAEGGSLLRPR